MVQSVIARSLDFEAKRSFLFYFSFFETGDRQFIRCLLKSLNSTLRWPPPTHFFERFKHTYVHMFIYHVNAIVCFSTQSRASRIVAIIVSVYICVLIEELPNSVTFPFEKMIFLRILYIRFLLSIYFPYNHCLILSQESECVFELKQS